MTPLELILIAIIWVFVGCFICHKRNWYQHKFNSKENEDVMFTIALAPIALLISLFKEFILDSWNNK
jgi:hypothetical protein